MNKQQQLFQIRTRKLGLLMSDARKLNRRTVEETAMAIGISEDELQAYEKGMKAPSLPELENFAFFLNVPIDHFWSNTSLSEVNDEKIFNQKDRLRRLRNRIIGASIRMHRTQLNFSLHEVSAATSIPEEKLAQYELGEEAVPLPELELIAKTCDLRIEEFFDKKGPIGEWRAKQIAQGQFLDLPEELRDFVCRPVNKPYLSLAIRLSQLSVDKLRSVAEGLLEITY
jgi:transcriptional regulator with XRE-family HTH domain